MPFTRGVFGDGGVRYPQAFATTPMCCPARASIFTGQYVHNHQVVSNRSQDMNLRQESTVQHYLQQAGYRTAIFGKYLNGWDLEENPPYFDRWAVFSRPVRSGSDGYFDVTFNNQGKLRTIANYSTNYIATRAARFIRNAEVDDARPWLLYLTPWAPHRPATPSLRYAAVPVPRFRLNPAMRESDRSDKPDYVREKELVPKRAISLFRDRQLRTLMSVDDLVEQVFTALWEAREGRRTLAFYLTDNGLLWGEHGLRGKLVPYSASTGIPMYARWPGRLPRGGVDRRLVANIDVAATILAAAGIESLNAPIDGHSILDPSVRTEMLTELRRSRRSIPIWASLRGAGYQYVQYYAADDTTVTFREYYDLGRDPWQLVNLLGDADPANDPDPTHLADLSARLWAARSCAGATCP